MLSLGNAFGHDELREFDARVRKGLGLAADDPRRGLRLRAEDRRPGDQPALRRPLLRPGRDPRRRHHRRGRDPQPADRARHPAAAAGGPAGGPARGARRGLHAARRLRARSTSSSSRSGKPLYANARNTAAGTVRQKDPAVTAGRRLSVWTYQVVGVPGLASHSESLDAACASWASRSIRTRGGSRGSRRSSSYVEEWAEARKDLDYETDGIVIKVDSVEQQQHAGLRVARPALGDRLQVPRPAGHHEARGDRGLRRAHRRADAGGARDAGRRWAAPPCATRRCTTSTRSGARTCGSATPSSCSGPAT